MAQSLSQIIIHIVFGTKMRYPLIKPEIENELYAYMGDTIKRNGGIPFLINGVEGHLHILSTLPKTITLAKFIEDIKRNSSRWIKTKGIAYQKFAWQRGYGAFSVSSSKKDVVYRYIARQKQHHKKTNFKEELLEFLQKYNVDYDERYLWD
ncbi:transposase [Sinomicrobium weinanense]|uniref:Transposase n=1 Tax=Sinomicrobium weinanense TaxID=2842200 RepID=A0A926JSR8_9FLAO|nr:transposase [Sinomicrobium weinanense]MBC9796847.1 transposase [Sinomicrobium weinanense]MBU3125220.1 transposase [Sinomicrobium weinanense]